MRFQTPLEPAVLIRRYKRFLADCRLPDGREVVAHVANPGAMTGLAQDGLRVWLEPNDDPKKKLKWAWRLAELPEGGMACVDTGVANRVVREALECGTLRFGDYPQWRAEVAYGEKSRVDFLLEGPAGRLWLEVKSVTLARQAGLAEFPDTVTARGARHMGELAAKVAEGDRAGLLFVVMRDDCTAVSVAADIDPAYARAVAAAQAAGVEIFAHRADLSPAGVTLGPELPPPLEIPAKAS